MDKNILEMAKHLKNKINSGEGIDEHNWQEIIEVCNEIERINNLEPVVFARHTGMQRPLDLTVSHTILNNWIGFNTKNPEIKDDIYPLFILD
ncbi:MULTISPECIES: hypothetical protein [Proteus]|uniref:Uncharacterized protein n=2 Tax=Proteus TaxID=583 RepID=A0A6I7D752_9GAMM|nr:MULTISPECIES: hypothetical protein [Proteus]MBI6340476.1 hypothetical protein [Proteus sp. PR00224]QHN10093.1 hypothetical protein F1325_06310 [Proteus columbae]GLX62267.1 hypothetical protein KMU_03070 [Proteus vulgaris]